MIVLYICLIAVAALMAVMIVRTLSFKPRAQEYPQQELVPFDREGFTVVEWGGTKIDR